MTIKTIKIGRKQFNSMHEQLKQTARNYELFPKEKGSKKLIEMTPEETDYCYTINYVDTSGVKLYSYTRYRNRSGLFGYDEIFDYTLMAEFQSRRPNFTGF